LATAAQLKQQSRTQMVCTIPTLQTAIGNAARFTADILIDQGIHTRVTLSPEITGRFSAGQSDLKEQQQGQGVPVQLPFGVVVFVFVFGVVVVVVVVVVVPSKVFHHRSWIFILKFPEELPLSVVFRHFLIHCWMRGVLQCVVIRFPLTSIFNPIPLSQ
jgi:hypothetical protein